MTGRTQRQRARMDQLVPAMTERTRRRPERSGRIGGFVRQPRPNEPDDAPAVGARRCRRVAAAQTNPRPAASAQARTNPTHAAPTVTPKEPDACRIGSGTNEPETGRMGTGTPNEPDGDRARAACKASTCGRGTGSAGVLGTHRCRRSPGCSSGPAGRRRGTMSGWPQRQRCRKSHWSAPQQRRAAAAPLSSERSWWRSPARSPVQSSSPCRCS